MGQPDEAEQRYNGNESCSETRRHQESPVCKFECGHRGHTSTLAAIGKWPRASGCEMLLARCGRGTTEDARRGQGLLDENGVRIPRRAESRTTAPNPSKDADPIVSGRLSSPRCAKNKHRPTRSLDRTAVSDVVLCRVLSNHAAQAACGSCAAFCLTVSSSSAADRVPPARCIN
jgi:hypothetical protein